jgi:hypothetical protein
MKRRVRSDVRKAIAMLNDTRHIAAEETQNGCRSYSRNGVRNMAGLRGDANHLRVGDI